MKLADRAGLKKRARELLQKAGDMPRRLVLLHTGGVLVVNLLLSLLLMAIGSRLEDTSGLAGMQTRAFWSTLQTLLLYLIPLATLLWNAAYYHIAIGLAREQPLTPGDLLEGFRHPISVLGCNAWQALQYFARAILAALLAYAIFSVTPFARPVEEVLRSVPTELVDGEVMLVLNDTILEALLPHMVPLYVIAALVFLPFALRLFYRFRLGMYLLMDGREPRCLNALRVSRWRMMGNKTAMLRLDLSFWWYYLLQALALAVCYLEAWLPALGVELPVNGLALGLSTYLAYAVCQLVLDLLVKNRVEVTYALAYDAIVQAEEPQA